MHKEPNKQEVGRRIKKIRSNKGESLEKFGLRFNPPANRSLVSAWENGRYLPNNDRIKVIANTSGSTVDEILYGIPEMEIVFDNYLHEILNEYIDGKKDVFGQEVDLLSRSAAEGLLKLIGQGRDLDKQALKNYEDHRIRIKNLEQYGTEYIENNYENYTYKQHLINYPNDTPKDFQKYIEHETKIFKEILDNFWNVFDISNSPYEWINERFTKQIMEELYSLSNKAIEEKNEHYYVNELVQPFLDQAAKDFKEYVKENTDIKE